MSFVTTAMSSRCRRRLHSRSTSAVLPEPTGPPTPTRNTSGRFESSMLRLLGARQSARQRSGFHRFHQMIVETGLLCTRPIHRLAVAGERNEANALAGGKRAQFPCDIVAVHLGQADIQQHNV